MKLKQCFTYVNFIEPNNMSPGPQTVRIVLWTVLLEERFRRWFTTAEVSNLCRNYKVQKLLS